MQNLNLDSESTETLKEYSDIFARLSLYCDLSILAREARLNGLIETALVHERNKERIYDKLPDEFKW